MDLTGLRKDFKIVWNYWIENNEEPKQSQEVYADDIKSHLHDDKYISDVAQLYKDIAAKIRKDGKP